MLLKNGIEFIINNNVSIQLDSDDIQNIYEKLNDNFEVIPDKNENCKS